MGIETEKKYRLDAVSADDVRRRLGESGALHVRDAFEENTIFQGGALDREREVLRLRRTGDGATLTLKRRRNVRAGIKTCDEYETAVSDADDAESILAGLGFRKALVYEKRRSVWRLGAVEVTLDELPFGDFAEVEGEAVEIERTQDLLGLRSCSVIAETYPEIASRWGKQTGDFTEARFE